MKIALAAQLLILACSAQASQIYDNGPVVDGSGLSILAPGNSTLGYGANAATGNSVADDFTIPIGQTWTISSLDFYAYQNFAVGFTFQTATWSVIAGNNINSGTIVASGTTDLTFAGLAGYRVTSSSLNDRIRPIYDANADVADFSLDAGHYWLTWGLTAFGSNAPYVAPDADNRPGNAMQYTGPGYTPLADSMSGSTPELPFAINGTVSAVPEPASWATALAGGLFLLAMTRHRRH